jgi:hypothetical protein
MQYAALRCAKEVWCSLRTSLSTCISAEQLAGGGMTSCHLQRVPHARRPATCISAVAEAVPFVRQSMAQKNIAYHW